MYISICNISCHNIIHLNTIFTVTSKQFTFNFSGPLVGGKMFFARSARECGPINICVILTLHRYRTCVCVGYTDELCTTGEPIEMLCWG